MRELRWLTILAVLLLVVAVGSVVLGAVLTGIFWAIVALALIQVDRD